MPLNATAGAINRKPDRSTGRVTFFYHGWLQNCFRRADRMWTLRCVIEAEPDLKACPVPSGFQVPHLRESARPGALRADQE